MAESGIDYLGLSGHKLYAPFGAGALVARAERLRAGAPMLRGGGAIDFVTLDDVVWAAPPDRREAGSPNVVGVVALGAACDALMEIGMDVVALRERALAERLWRGLDELPRVEQLRGWPADGGDRVAWPHSTSPATDILSWLASSPPNMQSAFVTAASAPIR